MRARWFVARHISRAVLAAAEERRWVRFSELGKQLCGLSGELPVEFDIDACEMVVEESEKQGRGLNLGKLASILTNKKDD